MITRGGTLMITKGGTLMITKGGYSKDYEGMVF